jgi:hypothetical protein
LKPYTGTGEELSRREATLPRTIDAGVIRWLAQEIVNLATKVITNKLFR